MGFKKLAQWKKGIVLGLVLSVLLSVWSFLDDSATATHVKWAVLMFFVQALNAQAMDVFGYDVGGFIYSRGVIFTIGSDMWAGRGQQIRFGWVVHVTQLVLMVCAGGIIGLIVSRTRPTPKNLAGSNPKQESLGQKQNSTMHQLG